MAQRAQPHWHRVRRAEHLPRSWLERQLGPPLLGAPAALHAGHRHAVPHRPRALAPHLDVRPAHPQAAVGGDLHRVLLPEHGAGYHCRALRFQGRGGVRGGHPAHLWRHRAARDCALLPAGVEAGVDLRGPSDQLLQVHLRQLPAGCCGSARASGGGPCRRPRPLTGIEAIECGDCHALNITWPSPPLASRRHLSDICHRRPGRRVVHYPLGPSVRLSDVAAYQQLLASAAKSGFRQLSRQPLPLAV
mmetsp:Transcript_2081/g.5298  ORF Transcript_2081/g.5298 Transcript_2081/m.5298 type:complete len:247 (-) Transcript_2081:230-970(-)